MSDVSQSEASGNIYFLTDDQREGVLWAIRLGLAYDEGFSFPRDQNREILRAAQDALTFPYKVDEATGETTRVEDTP